MKQLPVKYNDEQVGILSQDVSGKISFVYHKAWIEKGFPTHTSLLMHKHLITMGTYFTDEIVEQRIFEAM